MSNFRLIASKEIKLQNLIKKFYTFFYIFAWFYAESLSHPQELILYMLHRTYKDVPNLSIIKIVHHE